MTRGVATRQNTRTMTTPDDEKAILEVLHAESAAFFRRDFEALAACWLQTPEARRIFSGSSTGTRVQSGWDAIAAGFKEGISLAPKSFDIDLYLDRQNIQLTAMGDMAWVHYDQVMMQKDKDFWSKPLQHEVKIFHRVGGAWKIACMILIAPSQTDDALSQIHIGLDGRVLYVSTAAAEALADRAVLKISANRLHARNAEFEAGLQTRILAALDMLKTSLPPAVMNRGLKATPLGEDDFGKPHYCWVFAGEDCVVVTFDDEPKMIERLELAADVFALSPAQTALLKMLADGGNIADAAEGLGVSVNTVRTQLRRIFEKTGARDQAELISMALKVDPPPNRLPITEGF